MEYHQVEIHPDDWVKTAFSLPFWLVQYTIYAVWTYDGTRHCHALDDIVFSEMLYSIYLVYLDDNIIFGRTFNEHLKRLDLAKTRLKNAHLKLKPSKCLFGQRSVTFLGHIISDKQTSTNPAKLKRIQEWPQRWNQGKTRSFLGYATNYQKFNKGFAHIAAPLNSLLH